jgi:predicted ArsR family transcriptional regulator
MIPNDRTVLDLLRQQDMMTVADFETALGVTATAVRQRLNRLLDKGYIEKRRDPSAAGRGRPNHCYGLTAAGRRKTGANFADLAIVLWQEIRSIPDMDVRRGLIQRLATRLADVYRDSIQGCGLAERMESLAAMFAHRQIPFAVEVREGQLPVLTALACPYPDLAEQDRAICGVERMMVSELLGQPVALDQCRLNGDRCCTFAARPVHPDDGASGVPTWKGASQNVPEGSEL